MKNLYQPKRIITCAVAFLFFTCMHFSANAYQLMSTNFYIVDANGPTLMDGNITIYDTQYSNGVDWNDGTKMNNGGENWGLIRDGVSLVVERRQLVTGPDTAYFNMWGMQLRNYRFEISMENFNPLITAAYVYDNYLNQVTPVDFSNVTTINFTVDNNPLSKAKQRFKIIYTTPDNYTLVYNSINGILPVTITGINAQRNHDGVVVTWNVENELSMQSYQVEGSADGINFKPLSIVNALNSTGSHSYTYTDAGASKEINYYRVKALNRNNKFAYTNIAKVSAMGQDVAMVNVYPNPVTNKLVQLQWDNATTGTWTVNLVYAGGRMQAMKAINISNSQAVSSVQLPAMLAPGVYNLLFKNSKGETVTKSILVL